MEEKLKPFVGKSSVLAESSADGGADVGQGETHGEALRANAIYDALLERREGWYQKYRPGKVAPEVVPEVGKRYKRQAVRLVEAARAPVDFLGSLEQKGYKESTVKGWEKRVDLATRVLQDKFGGEGVAIEEGALPAGVAEEKLPSEGIFDVPSLKRTEDDVVLKPPAAEIAPEESRVGKVEMEPQREEEPEIERREEKPAEEKASDLTDEEVLALDPDSFDRLYRELYNKGQAEEAYRLLDLRSPKTQVSERPRVVEVGDVRQRISAAWEGLRRGFRARLSEGRATLKGAAAGLRERVATALPERGEIEDLLAEGKVRVLATPEEVKRWVSGLVDKLSAPFTSLTEEELQTALKVQEVKIPQELWKKLKEMDPATRRKVAITVGVAAGVLAVGGLGYYEIVGRHGAEFQMVAHHLSGIGQAGKELIAKAIEVIPTATGTPTQAATAIPPATPIPPATLIPPAAPMSPVSPVIPSVPTGAEGIVSHVPSITDQIRTALTTKYREMQLAAAQMRHLFQTGVEIVRGGSVWQASGKAAEQIIGASGVQSDPERLTILTDAIKDLAVQESGLKGVQPGAVVKINPGAVADRLAATIKHINQVQAAGGTLEVPVDQADLTALAKLVKFLKGF